MTPYQFIKRSLRTYGRYAIGEHELLSGDEIEWLGDGVVYTGTVEYTYTGYFVRRVQGAVSIALRLLEQSNVMARVRSKSSK